MMNDTLKNFLSKIYHSTAGRIFECAQLYSIEISKFGHKGYFQKIQGFTFVMPGKNDLPKLHDLYAEIPGKYQIIQKRILSGNFMCFAYRDDENDRIAYTRWLCTKQFYSDVLNKNIKLSENEALTLDSFTHPDYRKLGLHWRMNVVMLQWIKKNTEIQKVYMVIKFFIPHLTKYPKQLGYKPIETKIYYKKGSFLSILKKLTRVNR